MSFGQTNLTDSRYPKFLFVGPPFSGKTTLAASFPGCGVIDLDNKFDNALRQPTIAARLGKDLWVERPLLGADGVPIPPEKQWPAIDECVTRACLEPCIKTVVLDGLSGVSRALFEWIPLQTSSEAPLKIGGTNFMNRSMYRAYHRLMFQLVMKLLAARKMAIVIAHVSDWKDELIGSIQRGIAVAGESADTIPTYFQNAWMLEYDEKTKKRTVRASPGGFPKVDALGTALDLKDTFPAEFSAIEPALKAVKAI